MSDQSLIRRRSLLKASAAGAGFLAAGGTGLFAASSVAQNLFLAGAAAGSTVIEAWPTSPLTMNPFTDPLVVPQAARPVPFDTYSTWKHWKSGSYIIPGPGTGQQDAQGQTHQIYPGQSKTLDGRPNPVAGYASPLIYQIKVQL